MRAKYLNAQELCDAVYEVMRKSTGPMSRREIAAALGKKKSARMIFVIDGLWSQGYLRRIMARDNLGRETFFYEFVSGKDGVDCENLSSS